MNISAENDSSIIIIPNYKSFNTYPNPFDTIITFNFSLIEKGLVEFYILDENYQIMKTLINEVMESGSYSLNWDAKDIPAGFYRALINYNDRQCFSNIQKR